MIRWIVNFVEEDDEEMVLWIFVYFKIVYKIIEIYGNIVYRSVKSRLSGEA